MTGILSQSHTGTIYGTFMLYHAAGIFFQKSLIYNYPLFLYFCYFNWDFVWHINWKHLDTQHCIWHLKPLQRLCSDKSLYVKRGKVSVHNIHP